MCLWNFRPANKGSGSHGGPGLCVPALLTGPSSQMAPGTLLLHRASFRHCCDPRWLAAPCGEMASGPLRKAIPSDQARSERRTGHQSPVWQASVKRAVAVLEALDFAGPWQPIQGCPYTCDEHSHCNMRGLCPLRRNMVTMVCFLLREGKRYQANTPGCVLHTSLRHFVSFLFVSHLHKCDRDRELPAWRTVVSAYSTVPENKYGWNEWLQCNQKYLDNSLVSLINILFASYSYFKRIVWEKYRVEKKMKNGIFWYLVSPTNCHQIDMANGELHKRKCIF